MAKKAKAAARKPAKEKKPKQLILPDGQGGVIDPMVIRIPEIDQADEDWREKKLKRKEKMVELKETEDAAREHLKEVMQAHIDQLGDKREYVYVDGDDIRWRVRWKEPGVTSSKVKEQKVPKVRDGGKEAKGINPDAGEEIEELE